VINKTGAEEAGLEKGDKIIEVAGNDVQYFHQLKKVLEDNRGKKVDIKVLRGKENQKQIILTDVQVSEDATIGFYPEWQLNTSSIDYTFAEAIPLGTKRAFEVVWVNVKAFGKMFKGELDPTKSLRGPIGILQEFGGTWDWTRFWTLTGLLSMVLAFMNLLPIPALDGGHVTFLIYEIVSGRKPSDQFLENAQKVGMVILLMLMVFVFANDIINLFP
jgi:regulator of sigma E protease